MPLSLPPLILAAGTGDIDIFTAILNSQADEAGHTPLYYAVQTGNEDFVRQIMQSGYFLADGKAMDLAKGNIKKY